MDQISTRSPCKRNSSAVPGVQIMFYVRGLEPGRPSPKSTRRTLTPLPRRLPAATDITYVFGS